MNAKQLSHEWFEKRKLRITGSRIGAILGVSPWQKPEDVLRAMVREYHGAESEFVDNPAVQHGRMNESRARLAFMRETGLHIEECGFFEYGDRMGASPDALTSDGGVLEVKVPFGLRNEQEAKFKSLREQPHYYAQVQMELLSTGRGHGYFVQYVAPKGDPLSYDYVPEQINIERVDAEPQWVDDVLPAVNSFYARLIAELDNPEHLEPLRVEVNTPEAGLILTEIDKLRQRQKEDKERESELLDELKVMADGKDALVHGRRLTKVVREGSVSYSRIVKEHLPDLDLEPYRGKGSESWRLT